MRRLTNRSMPSMWQMMGHRMYPYAALPPVIALAGCTSDVEPEEVVETSAAIYNGYLASSGQLPEVVYVSTGSGSCTGTLIAPTTVLTAAHCFDNAPAASSVWVGFGTSFSDMQYVAAISYQVHPDYDIDFLFGMVTSSHHDIALVQLNSSVLSPVAKLVSPAEESAWVTEPSAALIAGFGDNNTGGSQHVKLYGWSLVTNVKEWVIRLDESPSSACFGDSGGPFFSQVNGVWKQAGVLSFGPPGCESWNKYARVTLDLAWIHTNASLPCDSGLPCGQRCFDFKCTAGWEDPYICPHDCPWTGCGDGTCNLDFIEEYNCPSDCWCGDMICDDFEKASSSCPDDCTPVGDGVCGDGNCNFSEDWVFCPVDCPH